MVDLDSETLFVRGNHPKVFPEQKFKIANLFDLMLFTQGERFEDKDNNVVNVKNISKKMFAKLKAITIYFCGSGNEVTIDASRLGGAIDFILFYNSKIKTEPFFYEGTGKKIEDGFPLVIAASSRAKIHISKDVMYSRDVVITATAAHSIYTLAGNRKRKNEIKIGSHVWLGQGSRIITG